jgi:hypothetical protein
VTRLTIDLCRDGGHYAYCGIYRPFTACPFGSHWHHVWGLEAFRFVERCDGEPYELCEPYEARER